MKRNRRWLGVVLVAVMVSGGWASEALAGRTWANKPARTLKHVKGKNVARQAKRPGAHPWQLTGDGATWFGTRAGVAKAKAEFHEFSERNIRQYLANRRVLDCADVALTNLADFLIHTGRRGALKVYAGGAKYIDTADFANAGEFTNFIRRNMGALNVIDNMRAVLRVKNIREPADLQVIQPGHARMKVHIPREGRMRGRPASGHTEPIVGVEIGETLAQSNLEIIYGNLDNNQATPVHATTKNVGREIKPSALVADHNFDSLGKVRTVVAPVSNYKTLLETGEAEGNQALAMGWAMIERGLGTLR